MTINAVQEGFDFNSDTGMSQYVSDFVLGPLLDPYGLAREELPIIWDGPGKTYASYGQADFDGHQSEEWIVADGGKGLVQKAMAIDGITSLAGPEGLAYFLNLLNDPDLSYTKDGRRVIFGTLDDDSLDPSDEKGPGLANVFNKFLLVGGTGNDTITGGGDSDKLLGGDDNDTLTGGKGNDYLEGGAGNDEYVFAAGDGMDTILDTDGLGKITLDGIQIMGQTGVAADQWVQAGNTWQDRQRHIGYNLVTQADGTQDLLIAATDNTLIVKNWHAGELGVTLGSATQAEPTIELTVSGDFQPLDQDPNADGIQLGYDALGNIFVDVNLPDPDREDTLYDSTGNDKLEGFGGDDVLIATRGGENTLLGGGGDDKLFGGYGIDVLDGGAGRDVLSGGDNSDRLYADRDNVEALSGTVPEDQVGDFLNGGAGDDILIGSGRSDALMGGEGNDIIMGGAGHDIILADASYMTADTDWTWKNSHQTYAAADDNTPTWGVGIGFSPVTGLLDTGTGGNDIVYGGDGGDYVLGGRGKDVIFGEAGMDFLDGGAGDDILYGGDGDDALEGDLNAAPELHGNDYLDLGSGQSHQFARGGGGADTIIGGDTDDTIEGDELRAGYTAYYHGDDIIDAMGGNDTVWGEGGADIIYGGDGDGGNDLLDGGAGADYLAGGAGDDIYLNVDGEDTINDTEGHNTIRLATATGLGAAGLSIANYGPQNQYRCLDIALDNGETLRLEDAFYGTDATLVFADGNAMDLDTLVGTRLSTALNLQLDNSGGKLYGGAAADQLFGGTGNDTLAGHKGNDTLQGGLGNDIYEFAVGDGQDTIIETGGALDTLRFKEGISTDNIKLTRYWASDEDSLRLELSDVNGFLTGDYVSVKNYFVGTSANNRVDYIEFADGTLWEYGDIQALILKPTEGNDTELSGFAGDDVIDGLGGNDSINGKAGNDWLKGGAGDDDLQGGLGNDILEGGDGNDRLLGYGVWLNDSTAVNNEAGNDVLDGGAGDDRLFGGNGADVYLFGRGDGSDYLSDSREDGRIDTLRLKAGVLPEHVAIYEQTLVIDGSSTQIYFDGIERIEFDNGNGSVWLADDILAHTEFGSFNAMTGTQGDDTFVVDYAGDTITEAAGGGVDTVLASRSYVLPANVENITLTGPLNINATGNSLDNVLIGNAGNNVLDGKAGNDTGYGGLGNDVYKNIEHIVEYADQGIDTWVVRDGGVLPDHVENISLYDGTGSHSIYNVSAIGNSLNNVLTSGGIGVTGDILDGRGGADTYIVKGWDRPIVYIDNIGDTVIGAPYEVRSYIDYALQEPSRYTSDNSYIPDSVANRLVLLGDTAINGRGNAVDNSITGNGGDNVLMGLAGNDNLSGGAGNDYLDGGNGNDNLSGGTGNDTYIVDSLGDVIVELYAQGIDSVESFVNHTLGVNLENLTLRGATALEAIGNAQDNILTGNDANNTLQGYAGNDYLHGGNGDDVLYGNKPDAAEWHAQSIDHQRQSLAAERRRSGANGYLCGRRIQSHVRRRQHRRLRRLQCRSGLAGR
ncbi:hypothetical protein NP590_01080 [Methylomonas sp. SURF-2]|uniref:Haemolysin-type calcium binding-related domain-containing protein n=1 Tax=Methylomonas subterranea TaxID=2952225 RepID=A0ABT1TB63_9GAMM|nr:calcium-binding protein [Methylomonas sp. SURF-2]MCQ8102681.1 hypothetical protein [Methylomonas sp. SURF-2]